MEKKRFKYIAINNQRTKVTGFVYSYTRDMAIQNIKTMNYRPIKVTALSDSGGDDELEEITPIVGHILYKDSSGAYQINFGEAPSNKEIIRFTGQLSTLLGAGVPLVEGLNILSEQQSSTQFSNELKRIRRLLEKGSSLCEAMSKIPKRFDTLYLAIIKSGEATGNLDNSLDYITKYMERNQKLVDQLKSALTYPTLVAVIAVGIVWAMLTFVIPTMAENFSDGQELPQITQIVMMFSDFCSSYWLETLILTGLSLTAFYFWKNSIAGKYIYDQLIMRIPYIGEVIHKIMVSRFCNVMSSMLSSGVPLIDVLQTSIDCCDNAYMSRTLKTVKEKVEKGEKLSFALQKTSIMPKMVVSMISIGEQSGKLDNMLSKVSEYFDEEVQLATTRVLALIEPCLIVVVGGFVAIMLVAIYLPIFSVADNF